MDEQVLVERRGALVHIRLNRPESLNSLTLSMVREISAALDRYSQDPSVSVFALTGAGDRAFCAGGDIKWLSVAGRKSPRVAEEFWREEYRLVDRIARLVKPWVPIMDGVTMGGGVGLAVHTRHRVATERTVWAMPECQIGFFPDVGTTRVLGKMPDGIGHFLGMSGQRLGAGDLVELNLADHFIESHSVPSLLEALAAGVPPERALSELISLPDPAIVTPHRELLASAFHRSSFGETLESLLRLRHPTFCSSVDALIRSSPRSLEITWRLLNLAKRDQSLTRTLARELRAARAAVVGQDFHEGVRAKLIDKDNRPNWQIDQGAAQRP
jgi:enoyl-CoA hydratase